MELLKSSILGKEFINYRRNTDKFDRLRFSKTVRSKEIGMIPIVIDSVDIKISNLISINKRYRRHGKEVSYHYTTCIGDILNDMLKIIKTEYPCINKYNFRLEDGTILEEKTILEDIYMKYRKDDDKILYLLITKEKTLYEYFLSVFNYIFSYSLWSSASSK